MARRSQHGRDRENSPHELTNLWSDGDAAASTRCPLTEALLSSRDANRTTEE